MSSVRSRCGVGIQLRPWVTHLEHVLSKDMTDIIDITRIIPRWGRHNAKIIPLSSRWAVDKARVIFPKDQVIHLFELVGNVPDST